MRTGRHRALNVLAMVSAVREQHWELTKPITPRILWNVLAAEGIDVLHGRIRRPARARGFDGFFAITIRRGLSLRAAWKWALHEYAHIKLGHFADGAEPVRQLAPCRKNDPRELEAKLFARSLVTGPAATPETPGVAELFDELTSQHYRLITPVQLPLAVPETMPAFAAKSLSDFTEGELRAHNTRRERYPTHMRRGARPRLPGSTIGLGCSHDALLFDWSRDGKPLRYFHLVLGWLEVYDGMRVVRDGRSSWVLVKCGDRRAEQRLFVISSADRRKYAFCEGEKRGRSPKELDRQIERATPNRIRSDNAAAAIRRHDPR